MNKRKRPRNKNRSYMGSAHHLCPCGSGKHYGDCHGKTLGKFAVEPINHPDPANYHLESSDGVNWVKKPGCGIFLIGGRRTVDSDQAIDSIVSPLITRASLEENNRLIDRIVDLQHKLYSVRYHVKTIDEEIKDRVTHFEKRYRAGSGAHFEIENPRLIYETEALLFQVKSTLDILTRVLGVVIKPLSSMHSFSKSSLDGVEYAGGSVIKALQKNGFPELGDLFENQRKEWIQSLVEMRDTVTHYSALRGFHCFIEEPYREDESVYVHYPTMPNGERVDVYCKGVSDRLLGLVEQALLLAPYPLSVERES